MYERTDTLPHLIYKDVGFTKNYQQCVDYLLWVYTAVIYWLMLAKEFSASAEKSDCNQQALLNFSCLVWPSPFVKELPHAKLSSVRLLQVTPWPH